MKEALIIDAVRTPIGKHGGSLSQGLCFLRLPAWKISVVPHAAAYAAGNRCTAMK